jgi:hypothetical protein
MYITASRIYTGPDYRQNAGSDRLRQCRPRGNQDGQVAVNRPEVRHNCCALRCTVRGAAVFFGNLGACNLIANPPPATVGSTPTGASHLAESGPVSSRIARSASCDG